LLLVVAQAVNVVMPLVVWVMEHKVDQVAVVVDKVVLAA
jgi:hypothetical protein